MTPGASCGYLRSVGDQGQRYEIRYQTHRSNRVRAFGWCSRRPQVLRRIAEGWPHVGRAWIVDRWQEEKRRELLRDAARRKRAAQNPVLTRQEPFRTAEGLTRDEKHYEARLDVGV